MVTRGLTHLRETLPIHLGTNARRATLTLTDQILYTHIAGGKPTPPTCCAGTVLTGGTVSCGAGWNLDPVCTHGTATVPSLNLQLEPTAPLRRGGSAPLIHSTRRGWASEAPAASPAGAGSAPGSGSSAAGDSASAAAAERLANALGSAAWLRHTLWRGAFDRTRDPAPGAQQESPPAGRYPAPHRGLVAVWPPRPAPTTCSRRLGRLSPEVSPPRTAPRSRPGGTGDSDEVCGRTYLLYSRVQP